MHTVDSALTALEKYEVDQTTLTDWEIKLGLNIPVDERGNKRYSPHHINLFKNVRKHLALGRSLEQIRDMVTLPPSEQGRVITHDAQPELLSPLAASKPAGIYTTRPATAPPATTIEATSPEVPSRESLITAKPPEIMPIVSVPQPTPADQAHQNGPVSISQRHNQSTSSSTLSVNQNGLLQLVERLMAEKDQLNKKLIETEKLNSHLYNANAMFHRKVKEYTAQVERMETDLEEARQKANEIDPIRVLDEKSRFHRQLLDMEKSLLTTSQSVVVKDQEISRLRQTVDEQNEALKQARKSVHPGYFMGDWEAVDRLSEVVYDTFGINFEGERKRTLHIPDMPQRVFGSTAVLTSHYDYEANPLWKRHETLVIAYVDDQHMAGELTTDYILDGVPVGKAVYQVTCQRFSPTV